MIIGEQLTLKRTLCDALNTRDNSKFRYIVLNDKLIGIYVFHNKRWRRISTADTLTIYVLYRNRDTETCIPAVFINGIFFRIYPNTIAHDGER